MFNDGRLDGQHLMIFSTMSWIWFRTCNSIRWSFLTASSFVFRPRCILLTRHTSSRLSTTGTPGLLWRWVDMGQPDITQEGVSSGILATTDSCKPNKFFLTWFTIYEPHNVRGCIYTTMETIQIDQCQLGECKHSWHIFKDIRTIVPVIYVSASPHRISNQSNDGKLRSWDFLETLLLCSLWLFSVRVVLAFISNTVRAEVCGSDGLPQPWLILNRDFNSWHVRCYLHLLYSCIVNNCNWLNWWFWLHFSWRALPLLGLDLSEIWI